MKFRITFSIALTVSIVLAALTTSDSTANAQQQLRFSVDTGIVTLGPNQILRVSVVSADGELGGGIYGVRFKQMNYIQDVCNGGVCKFVVASQNVSVPMRLLPGQALSFEVGPDIQGNGVRAVVLSNSRNVQVTASIIDSITGNVVSIDKSTPKLMEST